MLGGRFGALQLQKLNHRKSAEARSIWHLLHGAYEGEANIIEAKDFPPLRRTVADVGSAKAEFFGVSVETRLLAVCEISLSGGSNWEIAAFGVDPSSLRKGYGSMLLRHVMSQPQIAELSVSTASANTPAIRFYEKHGFSIGDEWLTPEVISMVTMVRRTVV
jgi:ribosomal protein S18 acetylase RimI-like enzyme